jgi:para-aminobenzoate synthetase component 1
MSSTTITKQCTAASRLVVPQIEFGTQQSCPLIEELHPAPDAHQVFECLAALPRPLFFDSSLKHATLGRYSFVTADPFDWLSARGQSVQVASERHPREPANPFHVLAELLSRYPSEPLPGLPPFQAGAAGMFGYDLCHHIERLPRPQFDEFHIPDLALGFYDWVVAFEHTADRAWVISTGLPESDSIRRRRRAQRRLAGIKRLVSRAAASGERQRTGTIHHSPLTTHQLVPQWPIPGCSGITSNFSRTAYLDAARRAIEYVHAGDCFQVNLAQRLLAPARLSPVQLYRRLRERNPATFAGYLDVGDFVIASASPERFLHVEQGEVETRPIKGTRPRGPNPTEDERQVRELEGSAKDRAENIMIVDLLRNDLGRVCRYGSVRVPALCRLESYQYVHHLVSEVRGSLREDLGPVDLLRAAFPGGSVTGAPKIRAMEIIAELEPTARGPYCGSLGYIGFDGTMDTNILIRTFTIGRGWIQFPVGGGIVADSVPEREYEETWHKAEGLLRALR